MRAAINHKNSDVAAAPGVTPISRTIGTNKIIAANYDFKVIKVYAAYNADKGFNSAPLGNANNPFGGTRPTASTDGKRDPARPVGAGGTRHRIGIGDAQ